MADSTSNAGFLQQGGTMGAHMRAKEWSGTPLGPVSEWPQSLRTSVSIMLNAPYPINVYWGPDFINLYNDAYLSIIGDKHPEALAQPLSEVWHEVWPSIEPMLESVIREGATHYQEHVQQFVERSGFVEEIFMTFSYGPIRQENGEIGGVFAAGVEATDAVLNDRRMRLLHEAALRVAGSRSRSEAATRIVDELEKQPEDVPFAAIYLRDDEGSIPLERFAGFGVPEGEVRLGPTLEADASALWRFSSVDESGEAELITDLNDRLDVTPTGPWEETLSSALVLPLVLERHAEAFGYLIAGVSSRRPLDDAYLTFFELLAQQVGQALVAARALEEKRERVEALEELDRAKTVFLNNLSHEFRTPLTLMLGPLRDLLNLQGSELAPAHRDQIDIARRNGLRLLKLVDNLLDFSRIEAGRLDAAYALTDLAPLTEDLCSLFRSAMERAGLRFKVRTEELGAKVYVDRDMWEDILLNLLSNALKYTHAGEVSVVLTEEAGQAVLQVRDTGIGISEEEIAQLFERFYRGTSHAGRSEEGTGIGLALVDELVAMHGGAIEVESTPGEGSTFTVRLPLGHEHLPEQQIVTEPRHAPFSANENAYVQEALRWLPGEGAMSATFPDHVDEPARLSPRRRPRVLIVDDNADMRSYLQRLLSDRFAVSAVSNGREALDRIGQQVPDLVLSDVMMPGLSGLELVRLVRADEQTATLPFILISARSDETSRVEGLEAGADDYLVKPFRARELVARIEGQLATAIERAQREHELRIKAEAASRSTNAFLASMSHEIRTPLTGIIGFASLLGGQVTGKATNYARRIEQSGSRLLDTLDSVLSLAELAAGKHRIELEPLVVADEAAAAVEHHRPQAAERGLQLTLQVTPEVRGMQAYLDRGSLNSILQNLIGNALKYTNKGRVDVRVDRSRVDAGELSELIADGYPLSEYCLRIHVVDTGIGIDPDFLPDIFSAFEQESKGWARNHEGTGLGLSIAKRLTDQMGGAIDVKSVRGKGSHFTVSFRAIDAQIDADPDQESAGSPDPDGRMNLLVVEDNEETALLIRSILEERYEVTIASSASEAFAAADEGSFDAVLLDIHLGESPSGTDVLAALKERSDHSSTAFAAVTAYALPGDRDDLLAKGFDAYLSKPFTPDQLHEMLRSLLQESAY